MVVYVFRNYEPPPAYSPATAYDAYPPRITVSSEPLWEQKLDCTPANPLAIGHALATNGDTLVAPGEVTSLYGFDAASGRQHWRYKHSASIINQPLMIDGVVLLREDTDLIALDAATGEKIWTGLPEDMRGDMRMGADDGILWITARKATIGLDPRTGERKYEIPSPNASQPGLSTEFPRFTGGILYIFGRRTRAVDPATARELWAFELAGSPQAMPALLDRTIFLLVKKVDIAREDLDNERLLYAHNIDSGQPIWTQVMPEPVTDVRAANGTVYVNGRFLYAFDAVTGREKWRFRARDEADDTRYPPPHFFDGLVYTAGIQDLYVLDEADGSELARFATRQRLAGEPLFSGPVAYFSLNIDKCGWLSAVQFSRKGD